MLKDILKLRLTPHPNPAWLSTLNESTDSAKQNSSALCRQSALLQGEGMTTTCLKTFFIFSKLSHSISLAKNIFTSFKQNMRISPLQNINSINKTNSKNANQTNSSNPNFQGFWNLFKRDKNLISANSAREMISNAGYNRESLKDCILTISTKYNSIRKKYYKDMVTTTINLISSGINILEILSIPKIFMRDVFFEFSDKMEKIIAMGYPRGHLNDIVKNKFSLDEATKILDLRNEAIKHREELSYPYCKFNDNELTTLIMDKPKNTLNMLKVLGRKSFIQSFKDKYDNVWHYLIEIGSLKDDFSEYQNMLKLTNPTESDEYLQNKAKIKELKQKFTGKDNKELIKQINDLTTKNRKMVANSIKDYRDKLILTQAIAMLSEENYSQESIDRIVKTLLKSYAEPNRKNIAKRQEIFNNIVTQDSNGKHCSQLDFKNNKHLNNLISSDYAFWENYMNLLSLLKQNRNKPIEKIFNNLKPNKETKKQFEELGINYNNWVKFNPKSFVEKEIILKDGKKAKIKVQKADMNDIKHSLFLGNYASCCTAVGSGANQASAPNYVINKMISCIEVKLGKEDIGNTMCYIAEIDKKPALIIDNIELKTVYRENDEIRDAIIEYAKKMVGEIGVKDMPIYASPRKHAVNMDKLPIEKKEFRIVGSNGERNTYFDFDIDFHAIDGKEIFENYFYKLS